MKTSQFGVKDKEVNLRKFDKRRFCKKIKDFIKKEGYEVFVYPDDINPRGYLGYALNGEIEFEDKKLNSKKIILLGEDLCGQELSLTFWHEVGHFILRKKKRCKKMNRNKKESFCEKFAKEKTK